jgi:DnaK suppressor protein
VHDEEGKVMSPIDELRDKLLQQRRNLFRQVAQVEGDLRWLETDVPAELEEESQEENIARVLTRLDERGNAEIQAIDRALARISNGDYGRCEECEEPIPVARLRALPTAMTCVTCAEARERASRTRAA